MKQIVLSTALFALAACQQPNDANIAIDESNAANADIETLPPDETMTNVENEVGNRAETPTAVTIPAAFHGRWGMVPADCTSTRGDAKGLVVIDSSSMQFYESRGRLTKIALDAPENFTGTFAFTGEGMTWTNSQNLKLTGSSNALVRKQSDVVQPFTYQRCA